MYRYKFYTVVNALLIGSVSKSNSRLSFAIYVSLSRISTCLSVVPGVTNADSATT